MTDATALIDGRITQIFVAKNSFVRKGDVIMTLMNDQIPIKIQQANSNIQRAEASYSQSLSNVQRAEAALANATNVYNRQQRLMARNATSQEKLEAAQAEYMAAQEGVKAAKAESDSARLAIEIAENERQQYTVQASRQDVISPIDGNVLLIYKREGAYVQGGTPLALIGNFDTLFFSTTLENADTRYLKVGEVVKIDFNERSLLKAYDTEYSAGNLGKSEKITARIIEINPSLEQPAVMRRILWEVNNRAHILEPLTYNNVSIQAGIGHKCLAVPVSAMADSENNLVFVVNPDGTIEKRAVETGGYDGEYIEIIRGLNDGEIVVLESFEGLDDGVKVEVTIEEGETNGGK
jgi:RND family efflux transporter MFP subunit